MRATRMVPLLLVLMVVAASCGGDGSVFETGSTTSAPQMEDLVDAEALAAAEMIVADLGPEPGMVAVGYALDRGYTAAQIAEAGLSGELRADGTIDGVEPGLPLWGIFADLPEASGAGAGGGTRTGQPMLGFADEPNPYEVQIRADQWTTSLATEADRVFSGLATPSAPSSGGSTTTTTEPPLPDEADRAVVMIALIMQLSALGYSAEQIVLGIVLGEQHPELVGTSLGPTACWMLRGSTDGRVIRPALPWSASPLFPETAECREAIDRLAPPDTSSSTTSSSTTTTTVDADGIQDGTYLGDIRVTGDVSQGAVYEILAGEIRLEVTDQGIDPEVAFTLRVSIRSRLEQPVCIATIDYRYRGQWPALETVGPPLAPVSQSIRSLEGPDCGVVDPWDTTAEDYLLASFAEQRTITVVGSFADGRFEGVITGTPLGVTAAIGG